MKNKGIFVATFRYVVDFCDYITRNLLTISFCSEYYDLIFHFEDKDDIIFQVNCAGAFFDYFKEYHPISISAIHHLKFKDQFITKSYFVDVIKVDENQFVYGDFIYNVFSDCSYDKD